MGKMLPFQPVASLGAKILTFSNAKNEQVRRPDGNLQRPFIER